MTGTEVTTSAPARRIVAWRFVVGAMIHVVPTLSAAIGFGWATVAWLGGSTPDVAMRSGLGVLGISSAIGVIATILAGIATASGSVIARRRQEWRLQHDPSAAPMRSRIQLDNGLSSLRSMVATGGPALVDAAQRIERVADGGWNHDDLLFQRLSRDLDATTRVMIAARADAGASDAEVERSATAAIAILAAAAEQARSDTRRGGAQLARTQAEYLRAAYAPEGELAIPMRDARIPIPLEDSRKAE